MKHYLFLGLLSLTIFASACKQKTTVDVKTDETPDASATSSTDGTYVIDANASTVKWKGEKPTGVHYGSVPVSSGNVMIANGNITGGTVELNMSGLTVTDPQGDMGANLQAHLRGETAGKEGDFFNVSKYPKATYVINSSEVLNNDPDGSHLLKGTLTVKEISKPVNFKAKVNIDNGKLTAATPEFPVDRTEFDIQFKSKKFFTNLKDDFINDE
ncbi:MAG TPA: YceI family protein, partial [Saprospiraceae bacterium]|nr:YceI family protein [Saprospiraceae bacterium]